MKAIIVYQSAYGHAGQMAGKMKEGLEESGLEVTLSAAKKTDPKMLLDYDAIIFGSPVRMGSVGNKMKTFIDTLGGVWLESALQNRVGGVLVSGGGFNAGTEMTQPALYSTLMELGSVMVGFVNDMPGYGTGANHWGPYAQVGLEGKDGPSEDCLTACYEYGKRVAGVTKSIRG